MKQQTLTGGEARKTPCEMYGGGRCKNEAEYLVTIPPSYAASRVVQKVCSTCLDELKETDNVEECRQLRAYERHEST